MKFKKRYDWTDCEGYNISGFTEKYARLLTDRLFEYAFHSSHVKTISDCKFAIRMVLTHYMPSDEFHTQCFCDQNLWCKTAFGNKQNRSNALKSDLPIGMGALFEQYLFDDVLDDTLLEILMRPGCTSLNEACNKVIANYSNKKRFLGA
eukprot:198629_1